MEGLRETGGFPFCTPKGALTHHLLKQAVVALTVGRARALSEGDCGSCGSRWTRLHFYQTASLAHAVGAGVSTLEAPVHGGGILRAISESCLRQPATGSLTQIQGWNKSFHPCRRYVAFHDVPVAIEYGRRVAAFHSSPSERTVDNGDLSFGGQDGQPWSWTLRRGCCGLSELFPNAQRV